MKIKYPPIYIVGPTGTGKSELALRLAKILDCVIISADSMQIYRGLDIGTAKVSADIRKTVEHKLINIVNCDEEFSVARFAEMARKEIDAAQRSGKLPIVVGGTGLYFEALIYPMRFANTDKNADLREKLQNEYNELGAKYLHDRLQELDEDTANRLHQNDIKRIIRALEIVLSTGKPLKDSSDIKNDPDVIMVGFNCDRTKLYERINDRVDEMFAAGLADEVLSVGSFEYQSMQAIGYKEFKDCKYTVEEYKNGEMQCLSSENFLQNSACRDDLRALNKKFILDDGEEERIKALIKQHTRNYAKRQLTWFRRYSFLKWFEVGDFDGAVEYISSKISNY